jgi:hypothetical protein
MLLASAFPLTTHVSRRTPQSLTSGVRPRLPMNIIRTLTILTLVIWSPAGRADLRGSLGCKAAKFTTYHWEENSRVWSEGILLLWLESGEKGQVLLSVVRAGKDDEQKLPLALKLISAEQANKILGEFVACRDAALQEAGHAPYPAGSKLKTWMFFQTVTAINNGENIDHGRSIPLDRAPKAHARFSKFLQENGAKGPSPSVIPEIPGLEPVIKPK